MSRRRFRVSLWADCRDTDITRHADRCWDADPQDTPTPVDTEPLDVLHAWVYGDTEDAFRMFIEGFRQRYPNVEFEKYLFRHLEPKMSIREATQNRLAADDPPSTWQAWPGANLRQFKADLIDIGDTVWREEMRTAYPEGAEAQVRLDGAYVAVPLHVHRTNGLFYNRQVLDAGGIDPASLSTSQALVEACETIEDDLDVTPFAHQTRNAWPTSQLWGTVLIATDGVEGFGTFVGGTETVARSGRLSKLSRHWNRSIRRTPENCREMTQLTC